MLSNPAPDVYRDESIYIVWPPATPVTVLTRISLTKYFTVPAEPLYSILNTSLVVYVPKKLPLYEPFS